MLSGIFDTLNSWNPNLDMLLWKSWLSPCPSPLLQNENLEADPAKMYISQQENSVILTQILRGGPETWPSAAFLEDTQSRSAYSWRTQHTGHWSTSHRPHLESEHKHIILPHGLSQLGVFLDTQTLTKHPSGHPKGFCEEFLKMFISSIFFSSPYYSIGIV